MIWHNSEHRDTKNNKTITVIGISNELEHTKDRIVIKLKYDDKEMILYTANPRIPDDIEPEDLFKVYHSKIRRIIKAIESGTVVYI